MTTLDGTTLLVRLGYTLHPGRPYFPPRTIMDEYLKYAQLHEGRLLYTDNRLGMSAKANEDTDHILLYSSKTLMMLVGDATGFGGPYDPDQWSKTSDYQLPRPWSMMPVR